MKLYCPVCRAKLKNHEKCDFCGIKIKNIDIELTPATLPEFKELVEAYI